MERPTIQTLLEEGKRPILTELDPPRQVEYQAFLQGAAELYRTGADAVTVADCPIGRASIDACMLAAKLRREYGIEPLPHMACRDRNLNAVKALLMGLEMEGVSSVLLVTGDPVSHEDREEIKGVFQMNSRTLAKAIGRLTEEKQLSPFFLCGALNVNARNFEKELDKARQKEESGIRAFLTQPVLTLRAERNIHLARRALRGYLLGGLFPVVSYRNACFLRDHVTGVEIDDGVIRAYEGLDREAGEEMGRALCRSAAEKIAGSVDGYYIMTPFHRVELVKRIMEDLRALDGKERPPCD